MKARERIVNCYLDSYDDPARIGRPIRFEAAIAIEAARLAPRIGWWASRQLALKLGCPVALWRLTYLCETGNHV